MVKKPRDLKSLRSKRHSNLGRLLVEVTRDFQSRALSSLHERGYDELRESHKSVLVHLGLNGARPSELAERAGMTRQAMGELLDDMERMGFVSRAPDPKDRRAKVVTFTPNGVALLEDGLAVIAELEDYYGKLLGKAKLNAVKKHLSELVAGLEIDMPE